MSHIDLQDTLLVELAREFEARQLWFGEPLAQACVYLVQELLVPSLGFSFYWHTGAPRSQQVVDCLEYARGQAWLIWKAHEGRYGPAYHCTALGLRFRDPSFAAAHREQLAHLLEVSLAQPGRARQLARVQFHISRHGHEEGRARLQQACPKAAADWEEVVSLLLDLKRSGCRPQVPA